MSGAAGNPVDHGGEDVNTFIYPAEWWWRRPRIR
jgi:hypothetical protein